MATPILNNWRHIARHGTAPGILVGEVSGHPLLPDGWITTSAVSEIAEDRSWAQTASRRYQLGTPLPDDERLPQAATYAVMNRLLRNAGGLSLAELDRLAAFAEELSEAPVKQVD